MKRKQQRAWALVGYRGWINHGSIRYNRRDVIADRIAEHRGYSSAARYADLTDAQFWRIIKRRSGLSVRRIVMRVLP